MSKKQKDTVEVPRWAAEKLAAAEALTLREMNDAKAAIAEALK